MPTNDIPSRSWLFSPQAVSLGLVAYYFTTAIVFLGVMLGKDRVEAPQGSSGPKRSFLACLVLYDGASYLQIVREGYRYEPGQKSNVAFFPAYPVCAYLLATTTGLPASWALVLLSHVFLVAAFIVLAAYVQERNPEANDEWATQVVLAFGLFPPTFFFRMAYTESLFLLLCLLTLTGIHRRWPIAVIAVLAGAATATRGPGIALLLPLTLHVWRLSGTRLSRVATLTWALPLGCWGLFAYMGYEYAAFGEPLAFVKTQLLWRIAPALTPSEKALALLTGRPLWAVYDPSSPTFWERWHTLPNPLLSLQFANPLYFLLAAVLITWGVWKRWLNRFEVSLAAGLLLIPYITKGYDNGMEGMARFSAVAFPIYLVMGRVLCWLPKPLPPLLLALSGVVMAIYAALFAAGYRFI